MRIRPIDILIPGVCGLVVFLAMSGKLANRAINPPTGGVRAAGGDQGGLISDLRPLFKAMAWVESRNNRLAYNTEEKAAGLYQIKPMYIRDINRILGGTYYTLADRYNPRKCEKMMQIYWGYYATPERLGRVPTIEDLARLHKGVGNFRNNKAVSDKYWNDIKERMAK